MTQIYFDFGNWTESFCEIFIEWHETGRISYNIIYEQQHMKCVYYAWPLPACSGIKRDYCCMLISSVKLKRYKILS